MQITQMLLSIIRMPIRKRKMKILRFTRTRITQITEKAKEMVAKTLAEVTAKVGAAEKGLAEKEKGN